jgi:electron transfer flavoprotein alpha subunit
LKWLPEEHWVGLSGKKVKPKLYLAIGISGQPQHIAGILDSRIIAAINNDPSAPIFQYVDYGVVEDLYKIVPILINKISKLKGG